MSSDNKVLNHTADIVSAYITRNNLPHGELSGLIKSVHASLTQTATPVAPAPAALTAPAVSVKKSITAEYLICLEDGRQFKSLKRHLQAKYGMTPEAYRAKWSLPKDYPMVAPAYSAARSAMAKSMKLGVKGNRTRAVKKA